MQLSFDKMNQPEVKSCFEAVSYLLFLTGTKVVSRKSMFTKIADSKDEVCPVRERLLPEQSKHCIPKARD